MSPKDSYVAVLWLLSKWGTNSKAPPVCAVLTIIIVVIIKVGLYCRCLTNVEPHYVIPTVMALVCTHVGAG